jgi:hypothetical protein
MYTDQGTIITNLYCLKILDFKSPGTMGMTEIFNSEVIVYCLGIEISNPRAL